MIHIVRILALTFALTGALASSAGRRQSARFGSVLYFIANSLWIIDCSMRSDWIQLIQFSVFLLLAIRGIRRWSIGCESKA